MAWNRNSGTEAGRSGDAPRRGMTLSAKCAVAALAVVVVAFVVWFAVREGGSAGTTAERSSSSLIREVKPALSQAQSAAESAGALRKRRSYWLNPTTNGLSECQIEKWKQYHRPPPRMTNDFFVTRTPEPYEIFPTRAENEIAMLLTMTPGEELVGDQHYGKWFEREFLKSCEQPIVISPDDDDYRRNLKKLMIETKIDLRNRMAAGEDLCEIIEESRNEMQRLGMLKQEIRQQTRQLIRDTARSEEDIDDSVAAMNKVLEEKGMAPVRMNPIVKRGLMRRLKISKPKK